MDIKYSQGNAPIHPPPAHYHPDGNIISLSIIWIHISEGDPELDAADPDGIIILLSIIWIHIGAGDQSQIQQQIHQQIHQYILVNMYKLI